MDLKSTEAFLQKRIGSDFHFADYRGESIPFHQLGKPISQCKVGLISSGGFYLASQEPFDTEALRGDLTYRVLPNTVTLDDLSIAHTHYKHQYVLADLNCAFPIELLRQLETDGTIGEFSQSVYSFNGYLLDIPGLEKQLAVQIARDLKDNQVDAVILAPVWPVCNHSVGVMARILEEYGIATVTLNMFPEIVSQVLPPRSVITSFVFGAPFGEPGNTTLHRSVLQSCIQLLEEADEPGASVKLDHQWCEGNKVN